MVPCSQTGSAGDTITSSGSIDYTVDLTSCVSATSWDIFLYFDLGVLAKFGVFHEQLESHDDISQLLSWVVDWRVVA
jgi:hypothetical protein